jgi:hypothetical protein
MVSEEVVAGLLLQLARIGTTKNIAQVFTI